MLYFLISMLIMLALLDRSLRIARLESLRLDVRFKLFALRDELRSAAVSGDVPKNRWFDYLDTSITKSIDVLPHLNVWEALALMYSYANDESVLDAQLELGKALEQEENQGLKKIYGMYLRYMVDLLVDRHKTSGSVVMGLAQMMGRVLNLTQKLAAILTSAPETSTLLKYHS